ncbi:sensor histidine kinase [Bacillus salitolerans]|uniref:Sensor histidine kinase n=1 Tax=Bacillus salitolerans TaxID=1437434 RepID=A0ABW4LP80_9BACI
MVTFNLYTALITIAMLAPIIGSITLFSILAFEREIDFLTHENQRIHLEKELKESEYLQLNQQIHPHFLFNTINLVLGLARLQKTEQLIKVLEHLSLFLKFKYQLREQLIPFSQELDYTKHYLTIQQIRLGERLTITYDVGTKDHDILIPPYLLQTLTENAFKHSLEKKVGQVELVIRFTTDETNAYLEVIDNGIGEIPANFDIDSSSGHGLRNIQSRFSLLFGKDASVQLDQIQDGGVKAIVIWPIKR